MNKEFDNIIKEKLGSFEEAPPAYMWGKIASGIPAAATQTVFYKTIGFKIATVAASIVVIIGLSWVLNSATKQNSISKPEQNQLIEVKQETINNSSYNNTSISYTEDKPTDINQKTEKLAPKKVKSNKVISKIKLDKPKKQSHENVAKVTKTSYHNANNSNTNSKVSKESKAILATKKEAVFVTSSSLISNNKAIEIAKQESSNVQDEDPIIVDNTSKKKDNKIEPLSEPEIVATNENEEIETKNTETIEESNENMEEKTIVKPIESAVVESSKTADNSEITNTNEPDDDIVNLKNDFNPKTREYNKYGLGLHYGYEYIKLNDDNIKTHNLDISLNYRNLNFILQTGIGGQYSKDERAYNLEYRKNEYLTTEVRFDSAIFVLDSTGAPQLIPVNPYYTDVYDSVNYVQSDNFTESYYSFRIPLMVGYQKDFGKFGGFIKGGFIYSVLITKNRSEVYSLDESSRLVMLQYSGSKRVDSQIQYVMSGGLVFRINKKMHLQTEIMGKYYQNSIYDNPIYDNIKPWSIEGRVGLVYFLN
ncbi:MAG: hypothetical protein DRI86_01895 [Bacteroidetes bacterium]|nr:MAG: hypothetical protein DRI86_01895 [Bacteroidota bacterium]